MKRSWQALGVLAVATLLGVAAVSVGAPPQVAAAAASGEGVEPKPQSGSSITIQTFQFRPSQLAVKVGTRVTWTNQDDISHTVTSGTPESRDGRFDSRLEGKGATFSITFNQPGAYTFFCNRHQSMRGQIRVD